MAKVNPTVKRLQYIQKIHGHIPGVVGATVAIVTGGTISAHSEFEHTRKAADDFFASGIPQIRNLGPRVNRRIPWIAAEARRAMVILATPRHQRDNLTPPPYPEFMPGEWPNIRDWLAQVNIDTKDLRWEDARRQAKAWHDAMAEREDAVMVIDRGPVLLTLDQGWTAQELNRPDLLQQEGRAMKHCVGGVWDEVEAGRIRIVSLRDEANRPHVTIEFDLEPGSTSFVLQIRGSANSIPKLAYHPFIHQTLSRLMGTEKSTMLTRYFAPGGPEAVWAEATQDEDGLYEYLEDFEYDALAEELRDASRGLWEVHGVIEDGVLAFKGTIDGLDVEEAVEGAEQWFTDMAYESFPQDMDPDDFDEIRFKAWEEGSSKAFESFLEDIGDHQVGKDGTFYLKLEIPVGTRKEARLWLSRHLNERGRLQRSVAQTEADTWYTEWNSAKENLGQRVADEAARALYRLLP